MSKVEDLFEDFNEDLKLSDLYSCGCTTGRLKGTDYIFFKDVCNNTVWWYSKQKVRVVILFEDVLDDVDDETKEKLLFHLDVFTSNDPEKIWNERS